MLVFYHGGGACMDAGYDCLALAISRIAAAAVVLVDIRGHGRSGGERGHVPTVETAYRDIDQLLTTLRQQFPAVQLDLGGHSSGAGLVLNYMTRFQRRSPVRRLLMIAPQLGRDAATHGSANGTEAFATARTWPFVLNLMSGGLLCGSTRAVTLNFAGLRPGLRGMMVESYTVNMALAVTPPQPARQLAALDLSTAIVAAGRDELFQPEGLAAIVAEAANPQVTLRTLAEATHLAILLDAHDAVVAVLDYRRLTGSREAAPPQSATR